MCSSVEEEELARLLSEIGAIKFGEFTLKSGKKSPIYIDLRIIPSYPDVLEYVVDAYIHVIKSKKISYDKIAGVPMSSIPLGAVVSYKLKTPFIYVRKDKKTYATMKTVEGNLKRGDRVLILDDVATTGSSILDAVAKLREEGAVVEDAVVLIDRGEGAAESLEKEGIKLHSFTNLKKVVELIKKQGLIDESMYNKVLEYLEKSE